jgi:hypothetical protein
MDKLEFKNLGGIKQKTFYDLLTIKITIEMS